MIIFLTMILKIILLLTIRYSDNNNDNVPCSVNKNYNKTDNDRPPNYNSYNNKSNNNNNVADDNNTVSNSVL